MTMFGARVVGSGYRPSCDCAVPPWEDCEHSTSMSDMDIVRRALPGSFAEQRSGRWFVFRPDEFIGQVSIGSGATVAEAWADVFALLRKHKAEQSMNSGETS